MFARRALLTASNHLPSSRSYNTMSTSSSTKPSLWLRCETKPHEHRSALTPTTAKKLLDAGFDITVERDPQRIFEDSEFEAYVLVLLVCLFTAGICSSFERC